MAMTLKTNRIICICHSVNEKEILRLLKRGARDLGEVKKFTLASTGCGRCKVEVEAVIEKYLSNKIADLQQNIEF